MFAEPSRCQALGRPHVVMAGQRLPDKEGCGSTDRAGLGSESLAGRSPQRGPASRDEG